MVEVSCTLWPRLCSLLLYFFKPRNIPIPSSVGSQEKPVRNPQALFILCLTPYSVHVLSNIWLFTFLLFPAQLSPLWIQSSPFRPTQKNELLLTLHFLQFLAALLTQPLSPWASKFVKVYTVPLSRGQMSATMSLTPIPSRGGEWGPLWKIACFLMEMSSALRT